MRQSALKFASEQVKMRTETEENRGKFQSFVKDLSRKVISVDYIQQFVQILASEVRAALLDQSKAYIRQRRALLRSDFEGYQDCVCAWIGLVDLEIERRARDIALRDGVDWDRLEPALGKFMLFSRFKHSVPLLHLMTDPPASQRKLSFHSYEEILRFASQLRSQAPPLRAQLAEPLRAKVAEAVVEDEVWLTFNVELREATEIITGKAACFA